VLVGASKRGGQPLSFFLQLLDVFWKAHNASEKSWLRQYMSAIFYHSEEQRQIALAAKAREEAKLPTGQIYTEILPLPLSTRRKTTIRSST
jgi:peptide methionine sulfoxide reductase MsrA